MAGPRPRSWIPEVTAAAPRLTTGKSLVITPSPGHFLTETHSPAGRASRRAVPRAQHLGPGPLFRARPGSPLQRRLSEAAGRASPEPGPRGVGLRFERAIQTENPKTKPRGEFLNFPCRCELDSLNLRRRDLGWTVQARTAPRRSQEPGAEKEWAVRTKPGRAPANVLSTLAAPKPPVRRPRG